MAEDAPAARTLTVTVAPVSGFLRATLEWSDSGSVSASRTVQARGCDELFSALVLMTALILDPDAQSFPRKVSPTSDRPETLSGGSRHGAMERAPSGAVPSAWPLPSELTVGMESTGSFLVLPRALLGAGAVGDWTARTWGAWRAGIRLEVIAGSTGTVETSSPQGSGSSEYQVLTGLFDVCPLRALLGSGWSLCPHAGVQVGSLWAQGQGPMILPATKQLLWLVAGTGLRVGYQVGARVSMELDVQALWPLARHRFHFTDPEIDIYDQPVLGLMTGIGFAYRAW